MVMIIETATQLDMTYIGWQQDFESAEFAYWADSRGIEVESGLFHVADIVDLLDKYYADTKQKH